MDVNQFGVNQINQKNRFNCEDVCYDDDGFFSDVQSSGSLSKSRIALNKYLKKNLLYEDVDTKDDSAYFSKEGSPNESVSKSDNESVKSNELYGPKKALPHVANITEFVKSYESDHPVKVSKQSSFELKSGVQRCETKQEHNDKISESESDYKVYPKETWPDKYRRKSDTESIKSKEINKTKRSMSQGVTIEEFVKSYGLTHKNQFNLKHNQINCDDTFTVNSISNRFVKGYETDHKTNPNKSLNEENRYIDSNSKLHIAERGNHDNIDVEKIVTDNSSLNSNTNYENSNSGKNVGQTNGVEETKKNEINRDAEILKSSLSYQLHRRLSQNSNTAESVENYSSDLKGNNNKICEIKLMVPEVVTILEFDTISKNESKNTVTSKYQSDTHEQNNDFDSVSSDSYPKYRYSPQEATIVITKIVKSYESADKDTSYINKKSLDVPKSSTENQQEQETRLPSPVPLPRNSSLRRNYKPCVPQRTEYSYDSTTGENSTRNDLQIQKNIGSLSTQDSWPQNKEPLKADKPYEIEYDVSNSVNVVQTDDYKSMQLLEKPKVNDYKSSSEPNYEATSASLTNLSKQNNPNDVRENEVTFREKSNRFEDHRHTLHDFTGWVNRTTKYPDVYAPMPYKSPRRYVESDVNIHYRCPVRHDPLPLVPERELARQQAEHMKRLYREQKRNKYLQELQDMQNRRHQDNFLPKEKTILPLNRYDEADRIVARALYAFNGQTARELSFRKGDLINVRRQIDANWYEGELHGRCGLFPYNYVEILKGDVAQSPRKPSVIEGRARAKFDFTAQTNLELPLKKGELVVLTRRIDHNWWEGRNGNKTGIFPDSYITVLQEPSQSKPEPELTQSYNKPVASPAAHGLMNGGAKRSMGPHSYMPQPNSPALSNAPQPTQPLPGYTAKPAQAMLTPSERGYGPPTTPGVDLNNSEPLYVDTNAEAVPYRAMYKYRPQNPDELELAEGDTVYVLEQCDDGWYVGSSQRTGRFGTFPGNYVERI